MLKAWKNITQTQRWSLGLSLMGLVLIRLFLLPVESNDFLIYLSKWYQHIVQGGGLNSLLTLTADYNLPYQYAMVVMTKLPLPDIVAIKLFSICFDFVLAYYVFKIVLELTAKEYPALISGTVALALPTIIMNSAGWGQSDVIYTSFLVATIYYVIKNKAGMAMLMYTLSFGFKIQAVFLGPLMLILLVKGFFRFKHLLIPVLYYLVVSFPMMLVGGTWTRILEIAAMQVNIRDGFSFYLPNIFYLLNIDNFFNYASTKYIFLGLFGIIILMLTFACYLRIDIKNPQQLLIWSAIFTLVIPFFLVRMHERYYFPAEYFWLILLFLDTKKYQSRFLIVLVTSCIGYLTVSWWGMHAYTYAILNIAVAFFYPILAIGILYTFTKLLIEELKVPHNAI